MWQCESYSLSSILFPSFSLSPCYFILNLSSFFLALLQFPSFSFPYSFVSNLFFSYGYFFVMLPPPYTWLSVLNSSNILSQMFMVFISTWLLFKINVVFFSLVNICSLLSIVFAHTFYSILPSNKVSAKVFIPLEMIHKLQNILGGFRR